MHVDGYGLGYGVAPNQFEVWSVHTAHRHVPGHGVSDVRDEEVTELRH